MPAPLANWNPARDAWETSHSHIDLFSGLSAVWSETWPSWGMWADGVAYALPTWAPLTAGSASSSSPGLLIPTPLNSDAGPRGGTTGFGLRDWSRNLLPTPDAYEGSRGGSQHPEKRKAGGHSPYLASVVEWTLLPTPKATDGTKGGPNQRGSSGDLTLPSAAMTLLPTPTATPYGSNQSPSPGAAVRPSLDTLAPTLLPTPTAMDSIGSRNCTAYRSPDAKPSSNGTTLTDWLWLREGWTGDRTDPPSTDGNAA